MARYSLEIKPSAGKELDALDGALFARIERKIMAVEAVSKLGVWKAEC